MLKHNVPGRRDFLRTAGVAAMVSAVPGEASPVPQAIRTSERPVAAVIGLGGRGQGLAEWQTPPFADVVAICDVDLRKTGKVAQTLAAKTGRKVEIEQDYRRLLDRKDIQVIVNATCDHWHTKITIDACRAGKDVYCEKPVTLTIDEGKILRKVVAETGRIVQVGTQQRSGLQFQIACNLIRNGRIGKLKQIGVIVPGGAFQQSRPCVAEAVPSELNWDMWLGQAPARPYCRARLSFRNWSDYGGGVVTDWGAHYMDIAHWAMGGEEVGPLSVEAQGYNSDIGKPDYPDQFRPFRAATIRGAAHAGALRIGAERCSVIGGDPGIVPDRSCAGRFGPPPGRLRSAGRGRPCAGAGHRPSGGRNPELRTRRRPAGRAAPARGTSTERR